MKQTGQILGARHCSLTILRGPSTNTSLLPQRGFSLLEVLISIIVLSFGLLGMVGMMAKALQSNREARFQSSAVNFARELGELMHANKDIGTQTTALANPYLIDWNSASAVPAAATNCFTGDCYSSPSTSKLAIASFDVREWVTRVNTELPGARVLVCYDDAPYNSSGVAQWGCTAGGTVAVIKIGWTRGSTDKSQTGASAFEKSTGAGAAPPSVVVPVTAGSTT
jgi:type IV pilus assembly protein PilV